MKKFGAILGEKFKNFHLNREKSIPLTIQEEQEKLKKLIHPLNYVFLISWITIIQMESLKLIQFLKNYF
jgi:hypothetical protein